MQNLKSLFKQNEWNLVQDILENGKTDSWLNYARDYEIRPGTTSEQRRKAANDVYRKYLRKAAAQIKQPKILIYDIETAKVNFELWWSGNQWVNGNNSLNDPRIITIAYKWLGSNKVGVVKWDKKKSDKQLMKEFLDIYNQADMVIGINNDKFDNKYINARAAKYGFDVNTHVKSLDIQKQCRRLFRLPSYSMKYLGKYFNLEQQKMKVSMQDIWEDIMYGTKKEAKKAMKLLVKYNIQDILTTEQLFLRLQKYLKCPIHVGVLQGNNKATCPISGSSNIELYKTTFTASGTIQRIMKCKDNGHTFKISNSVYLKEFVNE